MSLLCWHGELHKQAYYPDSHVLVPGVTILKTQENKNDWTCGVRNTPNFLMIDWLIDWVIHSFTHSLTWQTLTDISYVLATMLGEDKWAGCVWKNPVRAAHLEDKCMPCVSAEVDRWELYLGILQTDNNFRCGLWAMDSNFFPWLSLLLPVLIWWNICKLYENRRFGIHIRNWTRLNRKWIHITLWHEIYKVLS